MIILGCFVLISEFCAFGFFIYVQTSQQLMYILSNKMNNSYHTPNLPNNTPSFYSNFSSFIPPYDIISSHQPCLQPRPAEPYNQKQMKQLVEQIRFKEKMDIINKKKGKYKRSTNNCHKKYIGILKNLLFLKLDNENKEQLVNNYNQYRNSRVYYFIIMSYIKWCLCIADIRWIYHHFCKEVQNKMMRYKLEITTTNNVNFIHFRRDQIIEMNFSIKGINLFLMGEEQESIRLLYQKNKYIIIKKNQYLKTLQLIRQLGADLHRKYETLDLQKKVSQLKLHEVYQWKKEDTDKYNNFANISEEKMESISQEVHPRKRCDRKQEDDDWHQSSDSFQSRKKTKKAAFQPVLNLKKEMPRVKMEQPQIEQPIKNYPLIGLENSYPIVDFLTWHTWQLHKQKRFEFELKMRETMAYNQNFYIYFPLPTND